MNKKRQIETEQDLVDALEEFAYDVGEDETLNDVDEELKTLGYDPHAVKIRYQELASQAIASSPLDWRNRAGNEIAKAREKLGLMSNPELRALDKPSLVESIRQTLKRLGYSDPSLVPAQYRNFEQATESDLASLLQHLEYLLSSSNHKEE